jgi:hypothetical protein
MMRSTAESPPDTMPPSHDIESANDSAGSRQNTRTILRKKRFIIGTFLERMPQRRLSMAVDEVQTPGLQNGYI